MRKHDSLSSYQRGERDPQGRNVWMYANQKVEARRRYCVFKRGFGSRYRTQVMMGRLMELLRRP